MAFQDDFIRGCIPAILAHGSEHEKTAHPAVDSSPSHPSLGGRLHPLNPSHYRGPHNRYDSPIRCIARRYESPTAPLTIA